MEYLYLSLVDLPYNVKIKPEPVYTFAFNRPKKKRDGYIAKIRDNIYGTVRKTAKKSIKK